MEKLFYAGNSSSGIVRINANGTYDPTFSVGTGFPSPNLAYRFVSALSSGKYFVSGRFTSYNSVAAQGLLLLNSDGSVDTSVDFSSGMAPTGTMYVLHKVLKDGSILIFGSYSTYKGATAKKLFA